MTDTPECGAAPSIMMIIKTLVRARVLALLRPDKYLRMLLEIRRSGITATTGIALSAIRCPNRPALIDERGVMSWRELNDSCNALGAALQDLGLSSDGRVGILCRNHRGFVQSLAGIGRIGADAVMLNTSFAGPQLAEVMERESIVTVIYDQEFAPLVDDPVVPPSVARIVAWEESKSPRRSLDDLVGAGRGRRPCRPQRPGRIVLLTSGTTGTPKGASRPGGGDVATLVAVLDRIPWRAEETVVIAAPMFHAWGFGQFLIAATVGCTVVTARRFHPAQTLEMVERTGATGLAAVPVMIERIMDLPVEERTSRDLTSLRFVSASGSRMRSRSITAFMDEFGDTIYNSYNATEAGMVSIATPTDLRQAPETAGKPIMGTHVRLLDERGLPVADGEIGRIFVRSSTSFDGYTDGGQKDYVENHISSGDVGRFDPDGRLYVVGRDDDMIVSGGENVFPLEVERVLGDHPAVREAAVTGVDDESFGQRLAAWVVLEPGALISADDLKHHVRCNLASYKVPRDLTFIGELPRNPSGKILTRALRRGET